MIPKNQFVEVTPLPSEKKSGSIILPGSASVTHKRGVIRSFSDQLKGISNGDTIVYFKRGIVAEFPSSDSGSPGTEFIRFDQILCIE